MEQLLATLDTEKAAVVRQYVKNLEAANRRVGEKDERLVDALGSSSDSLDLGGDCRDGDQHGGARETASLDNLHKQDERVLIENRDRKKGTGKQRWMSESPRDGGGRGGDFRSKTVLRENGDQEDTQTFIDLQRRSDEHEDMSAHKKRGASKLKSRKSAPAGMASYALNPNFSPLSVLSTPPLHKKASHSAAQPERLRAHR